MHPSFDGLIHATCGTDSVSRNVQPVPEPPFAATPATGGGVGGLDVVVVREVVVFPTVDVVLVVEVPVVVEVGGAAVVVVLVVVPATVDVVDVVDVVLVPYWEAAAFVSTAKRESASRALVPPTVALATPNPTSAMTSTSGMRTRNHIFPCLLRPCMSVASPIGSHCTET
jgi:hypothetical protein